MLGDKNAVANLAARDPPSDLTQTRSASGRSAVKATS